jgi:hypothetical protein
MNQLRPRYPDISDILAQKASGRQQNAALRFSVKLDILDAMRARVEPLVHARKIRTATQRILQLGETGVHSPDQFKS